MRETSKYMNWLLKRKHLILVCAVMLLLVGHPLVRQLPVERVLYDAMLCFLFLAALLLIFGEWHFRLLGVLLSIPAIAGAWTGYAIHGLPRQGFAIGFHLSAMLFLGLAVAVVLKAIFREERVTGDSVAGAFGGYLLIGVAFGHLYCVLESAEPGSFRDLQPGASTSVDANPHALLTYFSFTTLTTVGYGDVLPQTPEARSLAITEAIVGQFYIAVLIAAIIGNWVAQAVGNKR
jgi:hypothetical protein